MELIKLCKLGVFAQSSQKYVSCQKQVLNSMHYHITYRTVFVIRVNSARRTMVADEEPHQLLKLRILT